MILSKRSKFYRRFFLRFIPAFITLPAIYFNQPNNKQQNRPAMSKIRKKKKRKQRSGSLLFNVNKALHEVAELIDSGDLSEALARLEEIAQRTPHRVDVFETMQYVALEVNDAKAMLNASLRLTELQPNEPLQHYNLIGAYQANIFVALIVQTGERFLERWPDFEAPNDLPKLVKELKKNLKKEAVKLELPEDSWLDIMVLHERVQVALMLNKYEETRRLASELIASAPHFVAPYNNRSLASWMIGDFEAAIADARHVLQIEAENIHASSNLVRFLLFTNRQAEAQEAAKRLKNARCTKPDDWLKKAEAFSFLGDDSAVYEIAKQAKKDGALMGKYDEPVLLHFAGVAAARLGDEKQARKFWKRALKLSQAHTIIQENLKDLDRPVNERNGAWPFDLSYWFHPVLFREFEDKISHISERENHAGKKILLDFLQRHPEFNTLIPILLERGDPAGREFALTLAKISETPEMLEVLKNYASSPHGPSHLRIQAITFLKDEGVVEKDETVQFWAEGEQREVQAMNFQIDGEPYQETHPKAVKDSRSGIRALRNNDFEQAERHFQNALEIDPKSASLRFNLAVAKIHQGDFAEGKKIMWSLVEQHPKYAFARTMLATIAIANGRKEEAQELIKSLHTFERFHYDEFASYCKTQVLFFLVSEPNAEGAKRWMDMWEQVTPDDPHLSMLKSAVSLSNLSRPVTRRILAAYVES
jgi:Flp pilus assembly protein TadD